MGRERALEPGPEMYQLMVERMFNFAAVPPAEIESYRAQALNDVREATAILATFDNESLIAVTVASDAVATAVQQEVEGEPSIEPERMHAAFELLVDAYAAQDEEMLESVWSGLGIDQPEEQQEILQNLQDMLGSLSGEVYPGGDTPEEVDETARWLGRMLTKPWRRQQETAQASTTAFRCLMTAAYLDPDRAERLYGELLRSEREEYYDAAQLAVEGLRHLTYRDGERSLALWQQALTHPSEAVREVAKLEAHITVKEIYETMTQPGRKYPPALSRFSFELVHKLRGLLGYYEPKQNEAS